MSRQRRLVETPGSRRLARVLFDLELRALESEIVGRQRRELIPPGVPASRPIQAALDAAVALAFARGIRQTIVRVAFSRRNLLALLQKLSMPGSARTLVSSNGFRDGEMADDLILVVSAEEDGPHYSARGFPPGAMHPATEQFLSDVQEQENGQ